MTGARSAGADPLFGSPILVRRSKLAPKARSIPSRNARQRPGRSPALRDGIQRAFGARRNVQTPDPGRRHHSRCRLVDSGPSAPWGLSGPYCGRLNQRMPQKPSTHSVPPAVGVRPAAHLLKLTTQTQAYTAGRLVLAVSQWAGFVRRSKRRGLPRLPSTVCWFHWFVQDCTLIV